MGMEHSSRGDIDYLVYVPRSFLRQIEATAIIRNKGKLETQQVRAGARAHTYHSGCIVKLSSVYARVAIPM